MRKTRVVCAFAAAGVLAAGVSTRQAPPAGTNANCTTYVRTYSAVQAEMARSRSEFVAGNGQQLDWVKYAACSLWVGAQGARLTAH